jgi:DMSO/TMAO reductase YedYZ heme-binding membrane subunit
MTHAYKLVQWNAHKKAYDLVVGALCVAYLAVFVGLGFALFPPPNDIAAPVLLMRALGTLAIVLLHVILLIGPLHRLDERFAPLLYNRRHLGVTFFVIALLHGVLSLMFYGGFGVVDPASVVFLGYGWSGGVASWPFEVFGVVALAIFFLMAATSHDYWLSVLSPRVWK